MPRGDASKCGKHVWRVLSKRQYTIMKRRMNESMVVVIENIRKTNIKEKTNGLIPVDAVRSATMP